MANSIYKPWLRNLYVRRLFILFGVPVAIPAIVGYVAIKTMREALTQSIEAWKPEHFDQLS
jgi:hypothetical protein